MSVTHRIRRQRWQGTAASAADAFAVRSMLRRENELSLLPALESAFAVLDDGEGPVGRLFPAGDHTALASAVVAALGEPYDGARGRARAASFDWQHIGPRVLEVYESAVAGSTSGLPPSISPLSVSQMLRRARKRSRR